MLSSTTILNIKITINDKKDIINYLINYLKQENTQPMTIFTPNPEQIVQAQKLFQFRQILNSGDVNLPDGQGVVWAVNLAQRSKLKAQSSRTGTFKRIPGVEFMEELVKIAADKSYPVALIGGKAGSAARSLNILKLKYPGLVGWGETPPQFKIKIKFTNKNSKFTKGMKSTTSTFAASDSETKEHIFLDLPNTYFDQLSQKIKESRVKIVFVGLGAPKQELFIQNLKSKMLNYKSPLIMMSVGGAFDIICGMLPRVPPPMKNFEFLWRLVLEPWRFFRQLRLLKFIFMVLWQRFMIK